MAQNELWETGEEAAQAEKFVQSAGVPMVMPVHHHPRCSGSEVRALCEQLGEREGVRVLVADEDEVFELGAL